jgi:predicted transcriptional regulator
LLTCIVRNQGFLPTSFGVVKENKMYLLPQEIEVWYIIPAIRKELARLLCKEHGLSYEKTGRILGVSKAAVSQYLSNKRANKIKITPEIKKEIANSAKLIYDNPRIAMEEMQRILKVMKDRKCSCEVCKKFNKDVLNFCGCDPKY